MAEELREALTEAISLYLSELGKAKHAELEDEPGSVTEHRMLVRTSDSRARAAPRPIPALGGTLAGISRPERHTLPDFACGWTLAHIS